MSEQNRVLACHHIELQDNCPWCNIYQHHSVRQCDRCRNGINTDMVFLSTRGSNPELICIYCHYDENKWGV